MLRRKIPVTTIPSSTSFSFVVTTTTSLSSSSPVLLSSDRSAATRSGPRAFKTDRQRRRLIRDSTALDSLPLSKYERERKSKLAPSSTNRGIDQMTSGYDASFDDLTRVGGRGRQYTVEYTLNVMRETLSSGPKSQNTQKDLVVASIQRGKKQKNVKVRKPIASMINSKSVETSASPKEKSDLTKREIDLEFEDAEEEEPEDIANPRINAQYANKEKRTATTQNTADQTGEDIDSTFSHQAEQGWEPVSPKLRRQHVSAAEQPNENITTTSNNRTNNITNNNSLTPSATKSPMKEEEEGLFVPLQPGTSSLVINDVDASRLDEIEMKRSNALTKRVDGLKPLTVFEDDDEMMDKYLKQKGDDDLSGAAAQKNMSVDPTSMREVMRRLRSEKLEDLSKKALEKYDGADVAQKEHFKSVASQAKKQFKNSDIGEHVATEFRGDEFDELASLKNQADEIYRHNALVKKKREQLKQIRERALIEQQQQQDQDENQDKEGNNNIDENRKNSILDALTQGKHPSEMKKKTHHHFDRSFEEKEETSSTNSDEQQPSSNNDDQLSPSSSVVDENSITTDESNSQKNNFYERPKSEAFIENGNLDSDYFTTRSFAQTETSGNTPPRLRKPSSEIIELQHSPTHRHRSEVAVAASHLPVKRFTEDQLEEASSEIVQQRTEIADVKEEIYSDEKQSMAPIDTYADRTLETRIREGFMHFYRKYPINNMITLRWVSLGGIQDDKGKLHRFEDSERPRLLLSEALKVAAEHGKDLIQVKVLVPDGRVAPLAKPGEEGGIAICYIGDHLGYAYDEIEAAIKFKGTHNRTYAEYSRPLLEIGFRGVSHDFAFRFKAIYIAKFLFKKFPVRIILTKFGTPREGFPIFERILEFVKTECARMNAHFVAGQIRYDSGSIWLYLHPSTFRLPLTATEAPSTSQMMETMEEAIFDAEYDREVTLPQSFTARQRQAANRYDRERDEGTAWAWRAEGISLAQLRKEKIHQGMLPKGNKKLYAGRGDVELNNRYKTHSQTGADSISFPRESNIAQAERGAGVLHSRYEMSVSEVLDKNEIPSETHTLGNFEFMMSGDCVYEAGRLKEAMGIKNNRKRAPKMATGFATIGQADDDGVTGGEAMKF